MSDVPPKYRANILEAIEALRLRKTRPDGPRIVSYCSKQFGISPSEVKLDLERLVDEDVVLKARKRKVFVWRWVPGSDCVFFPSVFLGGI